jgi:hypothetical protein
MTTPENYLSLAPATPHKLPQDIPKGLMPKPGDEYFAVRSGVSVGGHIYERGQRLTITAELIEDSFDRYRYSTLWVLNDESAQIRQWGKTAFLPMEQWPEEGVKPWESVDDEAYSHFLDVERERVSTIRDPLIQAQEFARLQTLFGNVSNPNKWGV